MGEVLYVAAVAEELGPLDGEALGIGLVAATAGAARLCAERRPAAVVLVGTAGAFPGADGIPIGAVVVGTSLVLGAPAVLLGLGYQPSPPPSLLADPALTGAMIHAGAVPAAVLTQLAITTDPDLAARLGVEWGVEHMEAYGVAWACHAAGVPFVAVLGITNGVGPDAHAQWRAHRSGAEASARDVAVHGMAAVRAMAARGWAG